MSAPARLALSFSLAAALAAISASNLHAAVSFTGTAYEQNFDTLATSGSPAWTQDTTLPGWFLYRQPANAPVDLAAYTAGTGSSNAGSIYSFGVSGDTDRALGGVGSGGTYFGGPATGAIAAWWAVALTNNTAAAIDAATIKFDGEQWRIGGTSTATQTMVLEYGIGATFPTVATWTAPSGTFNFICPQNSASAAAIVGNDAANRMADLGGDLTGLGWNVGDTLWVRWVEKNDASNDHGLAIDNFKFSTGGVVTPPPTNNSDFNNDMIVDGQDFLILQAGLGLTGVPANDKTTGDANGDHTVDVADLVLWQSHFGGLPTPATAATTAAPEPTAWMLAALAMSACAERRRRRD